MALTDFDREERLLQHDPLTLVPARRANHMQRGPRIKTIPRPRLVAQNPCQPPYRNTMRSQRSLNRSLRVAFGRRQLGSVGSLPSERYRNPDRPLG